MLTIAVLIMCLAYVAIGISSFCWVKKILPKKQSVIDRLLGSHLLFIAFIVLALLMLGIVGKLQFQYFLIIILLYSILSLWLCKEYKSLVVRLQRFANKIKLFWLHYPVSAQLIILVWLMTQIYAFVFVVLFPPFTNDSLGYHLPNVAKWYQEGRIHQIATPNWASNTLPMNQELIALSSVVLTGTDLFVEFGHILFIPMVVLSVIALGKSMGGTTQVSLLTAIGVTTIPAFYLQSVTNMSDYAFAASGLSALYWSIKWLERPLKSYACLLAVSCGLIVGTKSQGLHFTVALVLILVTVSFLKKVKIKDVILVSFLMFMGIVMLGSFWYAKNFHFFKNPFFPFEVRLPGYTFKNPPGSYPIGGYGASFKNLEINLGYTLNQLGNIRPHYHPDLAGINGWGSWFLFPGIFLVVHAVWINRVYRFIFSVISAYSLLILFTIFYQPGNARFLLLLGSLPFLALPAAMSGMHASKHTKAIEYLLFAHVLFTSIGCYRFGILDLDRVKTILSKPFLERSAYLMMPEWYEKIESIDSLPLSENIGFFGEQNELNYMLYEPTLTRKVYYLEPSNAGKILEQLDAHHLRYIVMQPTKPYLQVIKELESTGMFRRLSDKSLVYEYALKK